MRILILHLKAGKEVKNTQPKQEVRSSVIPVCVMLGWNVNEKKEKRK